MGRSRLARQSQPWAVGRREVSIGSACPEAARTSLGEMTEARQLAEDGSPGRPRLVSVWPEPEG